jgi:hypothetical protein
MSYLWALPIACIAVLLPLVTGLLLTWNWTTLGREARLVYSYWIGLAALIVAMSFLNLWMPVGQAAWPLVAVIGGAAVWRVRTGLVRRAGGVLRLLRDYPGFPAAVLVGGVVLLSPLARIGSLATFESTTNHDAFHYVTNAKWLLEHDALEPVVFSVAHPAFYKVNDFAGGLGRPLGRVGGEQYLALVSGLWGLDPYLTYNAVFAAFVFGWCALLLLVVGPRSAGWRAVPAWVVGGVSPWLVYFIANANYANFIGLMLLYLVWSLLERGRPTRDKARFWVATTLASAAFLATYPDMVPYLIAGLGLQWAWRLVRERRPGPALRQAAYYVAVAGVVTVACGWTVWNAAHVIRTVSGVSVTQGAAYPSFFAGLGLGRSVIYGTFINLFYPSWLTAPYIHLVTLGLLALFAIGLWRSRDRSLVWTGAAVSAVLFAYVLVRDFTYGESKVIQYSAFWLTVVLFEGLLFWFGPQPSRRRRLALWGVGIVAVAGVALGTWDSVRTMVRFAPYKSVSQDFAALTDAAADLPDDASVLIWDEDLEPDPYFYHAAMWTAYFLQDVPIYYAPRYVDGGYLSPLVEDDGASRLADARYVLMRSDVEPQVVQPYAGETLFENNRFKLLAADPRLLLRLGEGIGIQRRDGDGLFAEVSVRNRLEAASSVDAHLNVRGDAADALCLRVDAAVTCLAAGEGASLPLAAGRHTVIILPATAEPEDPEAIFRLRHLSLTEAPVFGPNASI